MTTTKWITVVIQDVFAAQKWFVCANQHAKQFTWRPI